MEEKKLESFTKHGTKEEPIEVSADEILNAIAEGRDVDVEYVVVDGDLDIGKIASRLEQDEMGKTVLRGYIRIQNSRICGPVVFNNCVFRSDALFGGTTFEKGAFFMYSRFGGIVIFTRARFMDDVRFLEASFVSTPFFNKALFNTIVSFQWARFYADVNFNDTIFPPQESNLYDLVVHSLNNISYRFP